MAIESFEAKYYIEGSQKPEEESPYWQLLRREPVLLDRFSGLWRLRVDWMIQAGEANVAENVVILGPLVPGG